MERSIILFFPEQEIPEKTTGKLEENKVFWVSNCREGHDGSGTQKQISLHLMNLFIHFRVI